jgi:integrase
MATFFKRGDKWVAQVAKGGVRKAASFTTKGKAVAWAVQTEADILQGVTGHFADKSFRDALQKYATEVSPTKRGARWELIRLRAWERLVFIDHKLQDVSTRLLAEWRDERLKTVANSTVNRELNLMAAVFEIARREWQWITVNPVRDVKRPVQPKHRERLFSDSERDAVVVALGFDGQRVETQQQIIAVAFLFALETAMRREEITGLSWERIDLHRQVLTLPVTKNGDAREVPLSKRAVELLRLMQRFDRPFPVNKDVLSALFGRACGHAGVSNAHFHDARATALTRLAHKLSVLELARMVGHRDIRSLQIYYRETAESLARKLD